MLWIIKGIPWNLINILSFPPVLVLFPAANMIPIEQIGFLDFLKTYTKIKKFKEKHYFRLLVDFFVLLFKENTRLSFFT